MTDATRLRAASELSRFRSRFPLLDRVTYFNACSLGPLPRSGAAALSEYLRVWDEQGTPAWFAEWLPRLAVLRRRLEELLHAPAGTVALAPSLSVAAIVATTHVLYTTGAVQDVAAIAEAAHRAGAYCLIDGYQSVGCLPLRVGEIGADVFVAGCLKWLSGGPGTAFTYCSRELLPQMGYWRRRYRLDVMNAIADDLCSRGRAVFNIEYRRTRASATSTLTHVQERHP